MVDAEARCGEERLVGGGVEVLLVELADESEGHCLWMKEGREE
jgi:hypothetical protein